MDIRKRAASWAKGMALGLAVMVVQALLAWWLNRLVAWCSSGALSLYALAALVAIVLPALLAVYWLRRRGLPWVAGFVLLQCAACIALLVLLGVVLSSLAGEHSLGAYG